MALNHLPTLMQRVAPVGGAHDAGLRVNQAAMETMPATLSLSGRFVPGSLEAVSEPRPAWAGTDDFGTAQAVARAGRPRSLAGVPGTPNLGRNPRGTNPSRWSRFSQAASYRRCQQGKPMANVLG